MASLSELVMAAETKQAGKMAADPLQSGAAAFAGGFKKGLDKDKQLMQAMKILEIQKKVEDLKHKVVSDKFIRNIMKNTYPNMFPEEYQEGDFNDIGSQGIPESLSKNTNQRKMFDLVNQNKITLGNKKINSSDIKDRYALTSTSSGIGIRPITNVRSNVKTNVRANVKKERPLSTTKQFENDFAEASNVIMQGGDPKMVYDWLVRKYPTKWDKKYDENFNAIVEQAQNIDRSAGQENTNVNQSEDTNQSAEKRFYELIREGHSEDEAYQILKQEGY